MPSVHSLVLPNMFGRKEIISNTLIQLFGKAISTASSLIITFLIGRYLGKTFYGDFTKVFATVTFLFMVLDFGLNATVVKRIAKKPQSKTKEFQHLFGLRLVAAVLLYLGLIVILTVIPTPVGQGYNALVKISIAVFGLQYLSQATFLSCNAIFQSRLQYIRSVTASTLGSLAQLGLIVYLVFTNTSLPAVAAAHLVGSLIIATISLVQLRPFVTGLLPRLNLLHARKLIIETAPIGLALVLNLFATRGDTILLTVMRPTDEVGFYGLARRIFDVTLVFPTFFMNAVYPVFLQKLKISPQRIKPLFKKALLVLLLVASVTLITLMVAAPLITLIRPEFAPAILALRILALALPLFFVTSLLLWTIIATEQQALLIKIYSLAFAFNLIINFLAIPHLGFRAPAIAAGLTEALVLLLLIKPIRQTFRSYAAKN